MAGVVMVVGVLALLWGMLIGVQIERRRHRRKDPMSTTPSGLTGKPTKRRSS